MMDEIDITKSALFISDFLRVMKSRIKSRGRPLRTEGREYDGFIYVLSGSCKYTFLDFEFTVKSSDMIYLAKDASYRMDVLTENYDVIWCDFVFSKDCKRKSAVYTPKIDAEPLFKRIYKEYTSMSLDSVQLCLSILYKIYGVAVLSRNLPYVDLGKREKIEEAVSYINRNYGDASLSVSDIAVREGMSEVYLRKLFRSVMGCSPSEYITLVRLKNAKSLLRYGFVTPRECALQCGFSSQQYFSRVFKAAYNLTPSQYAKGK